MRTPPFRLGDQVEFAVRQGRIARGSVIRVAPQASFDLHTVRWTDHHGKKRQRDFHRDDLRPVNLLLILAKVSA